jgi:hypothetical protein
MFTSSTLPPAYLQPSILSLRKLSFPGPQLLCENEEQWCSKFWMKKSQNMLVWLSEIVLTQHFCTRCLLRLAKGSKSPIPAVDWLDSLIGTGGLLLVVSHHLQFHF